MFSVCFKIRYISPDKGKIWDVIIPLDDLNQPRKYGFYTSIFSFANFHGNFDCDISRDAYNLRLWPECFIYLCLGDNLTVVGHGFAQWGHHGEPGGYRFS